MALATTVAVRGSTYRRPGRGSCPGGRQPGREPLGRLPRGRRGRHGEGRMEEGRAAWRAGTSRPTTTRSGASGSAATERSRSSSSRPRRPQRCRSGLWAALEAERPISVVTVVESEAPRSRPARGSSSDRTARPTARWARMRSTPPRWRPPRPRSRRSDPEVRSLADGVRAFVEVLDPPLRLVVCGAGHDAIPMVRAASGVGWNCNRRRRPSRVPHARALPRGEQVRRGVRAVRGPEGGRDRRANLRRRDDAQLPPGQGVPPSALDPPQRTSGCSARPRAPSGL